LATAPKKSARCPFHEDSSASFSLYVGDDGEERWKCFAGCGQGDAIDFLAKHRGLNNATPAGNTSASPMSAATRAAVEFQSVSIRATAV